MRKKFKKQLASYKSEVTKLHNDNFNLSLDIIGYKTRIEELLEILTNYSTVSSKVHIDIETEKIDSKTVLYTLVCSYVKDNNLVSTSKPLFKAKIDEIRHNSLYPCIRYCRNHKVRFSVSNDFTSVVTDFVYDKELNTIKEINQTPYDNL